MRRTLNSLSKRSRAGLVKTCAFLAVLAFPALAVDHNNIDATRPLDFDDADAVAYGEKALEMGAAIVKPKSGSTGFSGSMELMRGFAKNSHYSVDFNPSYASDNGNRRQLDASNLGLGVFHNFNREYGNTPALAARADMYLPTGRGSRGVDFRLRGIASKQFGQYGRLHLNLDLFVDNGGDTGDRKTQPGVILGYSVPLGYPTRFDRTLVAQVGHRANPTRGENGITTLGIGIRQQVGVQSVVDLGVKTDVSGGANRNTLQLIAGYSHQF